MKLEPTHFANYTPSAKLKVDGVYRIAKDPKNRNPVMFISAPDTEHIQENESVSGLGQLIDTYA
jgi:hypothetical protein